MDIIREFKHDNIIEIKKNIKRRGGVSEYVKIEENDAVMIIHDHSILVVSRKRPDIQFFELPIELHINESQHSIQIREYKYTFKTKKSFDNVLAYINEQLEMKHEIKRTKTKSRREPITYDINHNGADMFHVMIDGNDVEIQKGIDYETFGTESFTPKRFKVNNVFLGQEYGQEEEGKEGTTILLHLEHLDYVIIGGYYVRQFKAKSKITMFYSESMNSGVYMPFAIDDQNRIYMFDENIILQNVPEHAMKDLYNYYIDLNTKDKPEKIWK